ncbi:hypothetical protein Tco_0793891 [Tanacetum coccineum]
MLATGRYAIDRSRYEGKEIAKPITPPSESASEEDSDPEQAHKDKDMQKNCLSLQSTSRNSTILNQLKLRTSSTLKNKECGYYSKEQSDWLARHREEIYDKCGSTFTVTWQRFWRYAKMLSNVMMRRELTECKSILAETSRTLGESNSIRDSCLVALQNKQTGFERFKAFNDHTVDYDKLERRSYALSWKPCQGDSLNLPDHRWYDELADGKLKDETLALKTKIKDHGGDATPGSAEVEVIHENQGHKDDPYPEPSNCKVRIFEMMKYSFNDDEDYITIKKSEYLNQLKDILDAYQELLRLIDDGWVVTTPDEA